FPGYGADQERDHPSRSRTVSGPAMGISKMKVSSFQLLVSGKSMMAFTRNWKLTSLHRLDIHPMKRVHAFFLFHAVASARVASGSQILLHGFADADILDLNLLAEFHRALRHWRRMVFFRQIPF